MMITVPRVVLGNWFAGRVNCFPGIEVRAATSFTTVVMVVIGETVAVTRVLLVDQIAGRVTWFSGIATTITIIDISGPESVDGSTAGEKGYA